MSHLKEWMNPLLPLGVRLAIADGQIDRLRVRAEKLEQQRAECERQHQEKTAELIAEIHTADELRTQLAEAKQKITGLLDQHHRDSAELRRLCAARDEQRDGRLAALERAAAAEARLAELEQQPRAVPEGDRDEYALKVAKRLWALPAMPKPQLVATLQCAIRDAMDWAAPPPPAQADDAPFPARDPSKPAEQQGLFLKFHVRRVDGSDQPGGKHHGCRYFVLDMDHDQYAPAALRAYATACADTHPQLAADLRAEFGEGDQAQAAGGVGLSDDQLRDYWRSQGGNFYGPRVEHGAMPEAKLLPLLRALFAQQQPEVGHE